MKKMDLKTTGLTCANCANKIETEVNQMEEVETFTIDVINNNVKLKLKNDVKDEDILGSINKIADRIEPGAVFLGKEEDVEEKENFILYRIFASIVLLIASYFIKNETINLVMLVSSYLIVGYDVIIKAVQNLLRGKALEEHFLMSLATIGAFAINERFEAVLVMLLYQIGEYFQDLAVDQSKRSIENLMDIKPDFANVIKDGVEIRLNPDDVKVGDIILVRPGEKIPLDGIIVKGQGSLDTKSLTGESLPQDVSVGSELLSGSINIDGLLEIEVTKAYFESTVKQILDLVENASSNKAPAEKFIAKFARYYTPIVTLLAVILAFGVPLVTMGKLYDYNHLYNALTFLVISCPCALVISVPLSFFGGIGGASKEGILFKGSNYIEALAQVDHVLFDKTGTLTEGNFAVVDVITDGDVDEVIKYAAFAEYYSLHPIAKSIVSHYNQEIDPSKISNLEEIAHHGVGVEVDGERIWAGNYKLMQLQGIEADEYPTNNSVVYVSKGGKFLGVIVIADEIKEEAYLAVKNLRDLGLKDIEMLTGDNDLIASEVSKTLKLSNYHANLTPVDKVNLVQVAMDQGHKVAFVGDGINDAPVLTTADLGVAMGGLGSDAAIEAADIVIMDDNPNKLPLAISHSKRTMSIVKQNIIFALGVKFAFMILGVMGISNMAMAVFADVGVSLLAILNAVRLLHVKKN